MLLSQQLQVRPSILHKVSLFQKKEMQSEWKKINLFTV